MAIIDSNTNIAENRTSTVARQPPDLSFEASFTILQEPSQTQSAEQVRFPLVVTILNLVPFSVAEIVVPTEGEGGRLVVEGSYADADVKDCSSQNFPKTCAIHCVYVWDNNEQDATLSRHYVHV
ncbi:hypothetical protein MIR68_006611 [Amoeboaphelidium protococcarum]|nr:hypothetical protein MIR68_006611 [Amoeboaphelidium protococcarum]